jgi:aspartyl-tRNA(Asn)/glutamyl-tRNA(Gln) amidotransferase subunit C
MPIKEEQVRHVARLARLALDDRATANMAHGLNGILELVDQMNSRDTRDVQPMAHPFDATQRLREDVVSETDERETLQQGAPATEGGLYLVPRVID